MNLPFPTINPRLVDPVWMTTDEPADDDAELTALEQEHQKKLNAVAQQFSKQTPIGKPPAEPVEEVQTVDEDDRDTAANEESDESEDTHYEDDDDDQAEAPPRRPRTMYDVDAYYGTLNMNEAIQAHAIATGNPHPFGFHDD